MKAGAAVLILALGLLAAPLAGEAQQAGKVYRLGVISPAAPPAPSDFGAVSPLLSRALRELGCIEGQNLVIEQRYGEDKLDRLPALARELVEARVDVIVAVSLSGLRAAKDATQTIPIVMGFGPLIPSPSVS